MGQREGLLDLALAERASENPIQVRAGTRGNGPNITAGFGGFGVRKGWASMSLQRRFGAPTVSQAPS